MKKFGLILLGVILLVTAVLIMLAPRPPRAPESVASLVEMEQYFMALTASGDPPGLSVAVMKDGELVYDEAFGVADGVRGRLATSDTVYHFWSMTKMATATAVLQLHEAGKLDINDPVTDYLPFFEVVAPSGDTLPVTIAHLLNHSSGLPDTIPAMIGWVTIAEPLPNQTELLRRELPNFNELRFAPGTDTAYSNLGYMVLGAIIESVSGESYEVTVRANILQPLSMNHTAFVYSAALSSDAAVGSHPLVNLFTPFLPVLTDMDALVRERQGTRLWFEPFYIEATPPTGLIGSAADAAVLAAALNEPDQILSAESLALMRQTAVQRPFGWAEFGEMNGRSWLQHRGGGPGFASIMRLYPEEDLAIVLIANGTNLQSERLADLLATVTFEPSPS